MILVIPSTQMISHNNDTQVHEINFPFLDSLVTGTVIVPFCCEIVRLDNRGNVELLLIGGSILN